MLFVGSPEDRFSCYEAHILVVYLLWCFNPCPVEWMDMPCSFLVTSLPSSFIIHTLSNSIRGISGTFDFQQCGILTSVDSDEPVQPSFKLRNYKWCLFSGLRVIAYSSDQQRHWSDCAYAQSGLSLCWSHILHCWISHLATQWLSVPLFVSLSIMLSPCK